ncbi:MAG TPA: hypothetical protein PLK53_05020, partial [Bacillota bacterium]|nr:hypothetical protein [Bacillota bacterium]
QRPFSDLLARCTRNAQNPVSKNAAMPDSAMRNVAPNKNPMLGQRSGLAWLSMSPITPGGGLKLLSKLSSRSPSSE